MEDENINNQLNDLFNQLQSFDPATQKSPLKEIQKIYERNKITLFEYFVKCNSISILIECLNIKNEDVQLEILKMLKNMAKIKSENGQIQILLDAGILSYLIKFIDKSEQYRLAEEEFERRNEDYKKWKIEEEYWQEKCGGNDGDLVCQIYIRKPQKPVYSNVIEWPNSRIIKKSLHLLGYIIDANSYSCDYCLEKGIAEPLMKLFDFDLFEGGVSQHIALVVRKIFEKTKSLSVHEIIQSILLASPKLTNQSDPQNIIYILWGVWELSRKNPEIIQFPMPKNERWFWTFGGNLTSCKKNETQKRFLRFIGSIYLSSTDISVNPQKEYYFIVQRFDIMNELLTFSNDNSDAEELIVQTFFKMINCNKSHLINANKNQVKTIINADFILHIIQSLNADNFEIQRVSILAISNAIINGKSENIEFWIEKDIISKLFEILEISDTSNICIILESLLNILIKGKDSAEKIMEKIQDCNGFHKITALKQRKNEKIQILAAKLLNFMK